MNQQKLDERWFLRLREVSSKVEETQWFYENLRLSMRERESFVTNEIENPRFSYRQKESSVYDTSTIDDLRLEIATAEGNRVVKELYERKLEKQLKRSQLLFAAKNGNDQEFYMLSTELYGKPKKKYFAYIAKRLRELCEQAKTDFPTETKRLLKVVSKIDVSSTDISADVLPPLVEGAKEVRTQAQAVTIFQEVLDRLEISGWRLIVDTSQTRSRFSVNAFQKVVHIPSEAQLFARPKQITDIQLKALAEHEVGVHARRAAQAEQSPLQLLQIGLDSYITGEEGLAGYVQQQVEGSDEFYGFDRYLAASLAIGLDGQVRDFRAVFSLMADYYTLKYAVEAKEGTAPFRAAWDVCVRIFRGTTGQSAGCIYTKDIVYMEGNIGIWHLLSEKPHVFESMFVGKFNPLLSRHVKALQALEILQEW